MKLPTTKILSNLQGTNQRRLDSVEYSNQIGSDFAYAAIFYSV